MGKVLAEADSWKNALRKASPGHTRAYFYITHELGAAPQQPASLMVNAQLRQARGDSFSSFLSERIRLSLWQSRRHTCLLRSFHYNCLACDAFSNSGEVTDKPNVMPCGEERSQSVIKKVGAIFQMGFSSINSLQVIPREISF
jgi:hypothetical protein